ncbi:copper amine oxidase N-terminal domain-containing protein [Paenibacillus sp. PL91]|uniref:copper amine oxidase N-terminal domain-containing protein n=1 Tax=Paenibacillus sp. PL91 TaxID=2729538 RepID=UPI00145D205D|nr:copper amine oxidase N-terminal domain-containing protein [Paenibacillus sp. PL91]MBC9202381.1 copper amine oxidase N-terminal domain-containing protein [Paenibacillus sp. PL91]
MKKWIKTTAASLLIIGMLASGATVYAAPQKPTLVYMDGVLQENVLTVNQRTMVQLKAFNDPANLTYSYEQATKTIIIVHKEKNTTVRLKSGATTAEVNGKSVKLDAPVTIKAGRTYLPLRFISDTLGGVLKYNNTDKSVIVRTPSGEERFNILMHGDLAKAREMAIHYPKTYAGKEIEASGEGFTFSYTFPKGEALRFEIQYKGLIHYTEINQDGIAVVKWQNDSMGSNGEVGTRHEDFGESVFFTKHLMLEKNVFGTIDNQGKSTELGFNDYSLNKDLADVIIVPIEGEVRTDKQT